ncbi:MAG TPA: ATP-binding protein [Treponemataceae bacterium]|nr:ATP-binding protein [Treponemataceae bacterium]
MNKSFLGEYSRLNIVISSLLIIIVQLLSVTLIASFAIRELRQSSSVSADEISSILIEPLYNIDDRQTARIGEALLYSGRISRVTILSTASGLVFSRSVGNASFWIPEESRKISFRGIELGSLQIEFSDKVLNGMLGGFLLVTLLMIVSIILATYLANRYFFRKRAALAFNQLFQGIQSIGSGDYSARIEFSGYTDIDAVIETVNDIAVKIEASNRELMDANNTLETRVRLRTSELEAAMTEQKFLQNRLIEAEKMTALGQLSAGIAHELNTPLGAITTAAGTLTEFLEGELPMMADYTASLSPREKTLHNEVMRLGLECNRNPAKTAEARERLYELTAELEARGLERPADLAETLSYLGLGEKVDDLVPFLGTGKDAEIIQTSGETAIARRMTAIVAESAKKATGVVAALKAYLSPAAEDESVPIRIDRDIESVLALMRNMLTDGIVTKLELLPATAIGSPTRFTQVWITLLRIAAQSMRFSGTIKIRTGEWNKYAFVEIEDDGPGIPAETQDSLLKPDHSSNGQAFGSGLDSCRQIIQSCGGAITFESNPGKTVFTVTLPAAQHGAPGPD